MREQTEVRPLFSYESDAGWVAPDSTDWSYANWAASDRKGPYIRPLGGRCVVMLDHAEKEHNGILLATDSMMCHHTTGTVLAVQDSVVVPRALLRSKGVSERELELSPNVECPTDLRAGDRVFVLRFAGESLLGRTAQTMGHDRFRLVPVREIAALVDEG